VIVFLNTGLALTSGYVPGYNLSIVAVAPSFTAAVGAYSQAYAQVASILAPLMIGFLTKEVPYMCLYIPTLYKQNMLIRYSK
jgi:hypothetical protein